MEIEKNKIHAPEIGQIWLNSPPLTMRELRGRAVLVDFWDYTCVNCIRTLPYVAEWHRRYAGKGLVVVGVHTPEFSFARASDFVQAAIARFAIEYAVALDSDYQVWHAFANRCWPAKYLVDKAGYIRFFHFGEGEYQASEQAIQTLLREINPALEFPAPMEPIRDTDQPGAACYRATPELYLGSQRGAIGNPGGFQHHTEEKVGHYALPDRLEADVFYLSGPWRSGPESISAESRPDTEAASLLVFYTAKEANLVMAPNAAPATLPGQAAQTVELLQNGEPLPPEDAGEDVRYTPEGRSIVNVDMPRMYNLVRNREFAQRLLQLVTHGAGLECFAFTFVSCAASKQSQRGIES